MKTKKARIIACAVLALCALVGASVYAVYNYGTEDDPLVTKSYLDEVLTPELMAEFNAQLDAAQAQSSDGSFTVVTLSKGQTIKCQVGCQLMLRIGSASASGPDLPVLVDTTTGTTLDNGGALVTNHLYMVTIVNNGLTASADTTKVLVSGSYTVG